MSVLDDLGAWNRLCSRGERAGSLRNSYSVPAREPRAQLRDHRRSGGGARGLPALRTRLWRAGAGEEVTGIIWPVSLCMAITVALVRLLNPDGSASSSNAVVIASLAYNEDVRAWWWLPARCPVPPRGCNRSSRSNRRATIRAWCCCCFRRAVQRLQLGEVQRRRAQRHHFRRHHGRHDVRAGAALQVWGERCCTHAGFQLMPIGLSITCAGCNRPRARAVPNAPPAQCFRVIYAYMAFAMFDIFFLITAIVSLQVLQVSRGGCHALLPVPCLGRKGDGRDAATVLNTVLA